MSGETLRYCWARMHAGLALQLQILYYQLHKGAKIEKRFYTDTDVLTAFFS